MKVITVISDIDHLGFSLLKASCKYHKLDLIALVCEPRDYTSNRVKVEVLNNYLNSLNDNELVMFTDGYDTIMLSGEKEIMHKFEAYNTKLLFSAETNCYPDSSLESKYPKLSESPFRYLNSGGFLGKVGIIRRNIAFSSELNPDFDSCDQYFWTTRYLDNQHEIMLDSNRNLFCTLSPEMGGEGFMSKNVSSYFDYFVKMEEWFEKTFILSGERLVCKVTGSQPCNLHFNGKAKCLIRHRIISPILTRIFPDLLPQMKNYVNSINNQKFKDDFSKVISSSNELVKS